ncbi:MAG: ABC transporter substrate-binding protein [Acidimicrobiales bacterium]
MTRRLQVRGAAGLGLAVTLSLVASACGGGGSPAGSHGGAGTTAGGSSSGHPFNVVVFDTLSGTEASFTPEDIASTNAAADVINAAGPPLGHKITVSVFNSYDDPADSTTAARHMLATEKNVLCVVGPQTLPAPAVDPILNAGGYPFFSESGDPATNVNHFAYYWRNQPADNVEGYALAIWGHQKGFTKAAAVFSNQSGSGEVPDLVKGFTKLGGKIVLNDTVVLDQTSYRTEVSKLLASKPQVIFNELDAQSAATFFSELQQQNHGQMLPVIDDGYLISYPPTLQSVRKVVGASQLAQYWQGVEIVGATDTPGWKQYNHALSVLKVVKDPLQYNNDPYAQGGYDGVMTTSLAAIASKSDNPQVINEWIPKVTAPGKGKTVVYTYAAGKAALDAGKSIQYVGVGGPELYDQYHNSQLPFQAAAVQPDGTTKIVGEVSQKELARFTGATKG